MKIGVVCYPTMGGSGIVATELGHELALRGHEVHFITYEIPFRLRLEEKNIYFHEVEINQYDLFKYPDYALTLAVKIARVVEAHELDILHVHYAIPHATSAFLAKQILKRAKLCVITTLHGTDITLVGRDPAYYEIVKFSIEQSDGVTVVSNALKWQTCKYFHLDKEVEVIYNFFIPRPDLAESKPKRSLFVHGAQKLLLHSSNYRSVKRPEDIVAVFSNVRQQLDCRLLLLGSGEGIEDVRRALSRKGLEKEVFFIGKSRDIDPYVASADLFLLPSSQESFGLAALEAMAYGVPVIASNAGGIPEVVQDGVSGYLSDVGDVEKMARDAVFLLTHEEVYRTFSQEASRQAQEHFSVSEIVLQYEEYYKRVMETMK